MQNTLYLLIIAIVVVDFLFERLIDYLNHSHRNHPVPEELQGIFDQEEYQRSQDYARVNHRFGMLTSSFSFLLIMAMLVFYGFALVDNWASQVSPHYILSALIFFAILGLASEVLSMPFSVYDTFVIEEKFGFNKTTPKLFIADTLKGWVLTAILGGLLLSAILWIWKQTGAWFWLWAWLLVTAFTLFFTLFYSNLIVPLFNKQTPLEEGPLKEAINQFALKAGFKLKNIYVIDGSKRSTKSNAYFTGLGPKKRIVLYDTLINDLSQDEIVAVLAHEIGHYKKKHSLTTMIISVIQTGMILALFSWLAKNEGLSGALGVSETKFHIALLAFGILFTPVSFVLGIGMNLLSRKHEYEADAFASSFGLGQALVSGLKKLTSKNLGNLTPHPAYVFFHYSHPTLLQRIRRINQPGPQPQKK